MSSHEILQKERFMTYDWWGVYDEGAVKSFGSAHVVQPMVYILRYSAFWIVRGAMDSFANKN